MKKMLTVLASVAALSMAPSVAQAQLHWTMLGDLTITGSTMPTSGVQFGGTGGGYSATFTLQNFQGQNRTFTDYLVWCIDPERSVAVGNSYSGYKAYDLQGYVAIPGESKAGYQQSLGDMKAIASLVDEVSENYGPWAAGQVRTWQDGIWSRFEGVAPQARPGFTPQYGNAKFNGRDFYVLYNDQNQTFMFEVAEPGVLFMLAAGASLLAFVALRRRGTV
jgi:hypothetical protein